MLKHSKAGVPVEVMGLLLGNFVDEINISVNDVFAMPQTGTGISVESLDPSFQTKMLDLLSQLGNKSLIVGWYHSHPGFGCWLSGVDINTQQNFENLNKRSVAIVIDPIQSFKNRMFIEAYRLFSGNQKVRLERESLSITSNIDTKSFQKDDQGINKYYYSLRISTIKNVIEELLISSVFKCSIDSKAFDKKLFISKYNLDITKIIIETIIKLRTLILNIKISNKKIYRSLEELLSKVRKLISKNLIIISNLVTII